MTAFVDFALFKVAFEMQRSKPKTKRICKTYAFNATNPPSSVIPAKAGIQTKTLRTIRGSALRATWIPAFLRDGRPQKRGYRFVVGTTRRDAGITEYGGFAKS
jgi:hypothetical protein